MTIIAAIRTTDSILMGGDSAQHTNGSLATVREPKVFENGDYLFGVSGAPRITEILRYEFKPPTKFRQMTWNQFLARTFLPSLKAALGADAALEKSGILMATKGGGIFEVNHNWFVVQTVEPYAAIGSGANWALGSFHSTRGKPRRRLLKALGAAAHFNAYVRPPFTILELPEKELDEEFWGSAEELPDRHAPYRIDADDHGWDGDSEV